MPRLHLMTVQLRRGVLQVNLGPALPRQPLLAGRQIERNAIQPGGKTRFAPKAVQRAVDLDEHLLSQIVGRGLVSIAQAPGPTAYRRLIAQDQLPEGVLVLLGHDAGNQARVRQRLRIRDHYCA